MPSIFDGMAGVLNSTFGASVVITNIVGQTVALQAVFRDDPIEIISQDGRPTTIIAPTLRITKNLLAAIGVGYEARPASVAPRKFRVLRALPSPSPASDAMITCELEEF